MTNKPHEPYHPVECGLHSQYELAIMHRVMLQLVWSDAQNQQHVGNILPLDLITREHSEFLIGQSNDGEIHHIRLDLIHRSNVAEVI